MADYPNLRICLGSQAIPQSGIKTDRTSNGAARGQCFYSADKQNFVIKHTWLSADEKNTLDNFYATNKQNTFTFDWKDGQTYTVIFADAPKYDLRQCMWWDASVELWEV